MTGDMDKASEQYVVFKLAASEYAINIAYVAELLRMVAITPLPASPEWVLGVVNLRGKVIPVIDLRVRLSLPAEALDLNTPIIVTQVDDVMAGLVVDDVTDVLSVDPNALTRAHESLTSDHLIAGVAKIQDRLLLIVNLPRLSADFPRIATAGSEVG
jgi:purine-binding chemotaxis protein CheW